MALNLHQQILEQIKSSQHILIATPKLDNGGGLTAALALRLILTKLNKPIELIASPAAIDKLRFLAGSDQARPELASFKKFTISINTAKTKIQEFSYDIKSDRLDIYITPKGGNITGDDISFNSGEYKYDLIFTLSAPDLESLGECYEQNSSFFFNTTIINIDNNPANEHYGQINLIDLSASSVSEIIFDWLKSTNLDLIDETIATNILAGIIIQTKSFKHHSVTPKSLTASAELMKLGADREIIVKRLYRNKTLATLNLWGRVLARLKQDTHYKLAWSMLSRADFVKANGSPENLAGVVEELLSSSPSIEIALILYETESGQIAAELHASSNYNALDLARPWNPLGTPVQADFYLDTDKLIEAENLTINQIRERIKPIK